MPIKSLYKVEIAGTNEEPEGYAVVYNNTNGWGSSWLVANMYQASKTILTHCLGHVVDPALIKRFEKDFLTEEVRLSLHHKGPFEITPTGVNRWADK